jgi:hypothetical protein
MHNVYDTDKRKILSSLCHASIFFSSLVVAAGVPVAIWFVSEDPVVKANAQEAINFHFNVWLYGIIFGVLAWVLIGLPLLAILFVVHWTLPVLAILQCLNNPEQPYRYPFIFRLL